MILVGGAEIYRNTETNPEKRCYPGGFFDPLKLASEDEERAFRLKTAEIKHARLAMVSVLVLLCLLRLGCSCCALWGTTALHSVLMPKRVPPCGLLLPP